MYVLTYLLSYLLTYLLSYLLTYLFTFLFTYLFTFLLTYLFTFLFTYLLIYFHTYSLTYLLTHLLTHSMQHSPSWEANRFSASQEIPRILWNQKIHYRIHKCLPPVSIFSQLDLVHTPTSHFLKIHLNTIFPSTRGSPNRSLSFRFPHQNPVYACPFPHTRYMPHPSHSSRFDHNICWAIQIIKLLIVYFSPLPCYLVPF
jgi:hypothetical protein